MLSTLYVPALIIDPYNRSIHSAAFSFEPLVILTILVKVFFLSPGLILSGLYPQKKSSFSFKSEDFDKRGIQTSWVAPGKTVLSYITMGLNLFVFLLKPYLPKNLPLLML